jgi:hypothetical protein
MSCRVFFCIFSAATILCGHLSAAPTQARHRLDGHLSGTWKNLPPLGPLAATNEIRMAIGLQLRDPAGLEKFLADVYDPSSQNYRKFLTADELAARFGPTEADYEAVKQFALASGFKIAATHGNRLLLDVSGQAGDVERAFNFHLLRYRHPVQAREFFAPDAEPSVDVSLPVADIQGLSDFSRPYPRSRRLPAGNALFHSGTSPDGAGLLFGDDFRKAYAPGTTLTGAGQMVGLVQFDGYYTNDILSYARAAGGGRTNIPIQKVLLDGFNGTPTTGTNSGNGEVSLDIEMAMAVAPGLSKIVVFEAGPSGLQNDVLNSMLTFSNALKNLSSSWGWDGGPNTTTDNIFKLLAAAGQSFFNASGDTDAFVSGSNNDVDNTNQANAPSSSPYITQVGGTVMNTNGFNGAYTSESVWNDRVVNPNGGNWGSSGGISSYYAIPSWQANTSMASNGGSTTKRNIPDVALTADYVYSTYDNGGSGRTGGTSCAAPLWAGFMALVNQQAASQGAASVGFINPAIYALSATANYTNCFHDTTVGDNSWSSSGGKFAAVAGYDLATGLGSPNGVNLINALVPPASTAPTITSSPQSQTNTFGANATFTVAANGSAPLAYQWYFTNAIPGSTNSTLVVGNLTAASAGNYFAVVTNAFGGATSTVATLTVLLSPAIIQPPASQSVAIGQSASFNVAAAGAPSLAYQWRKDSNSIAGATGTNYFIASVAAGDAGSYDVVVTNNYGSVTSSVAQLTAVNASSYGGVLAAWEVSALSGYGPSPFAATSNAPNVTVAGLTRGSGVGTANTAAAGAWGGTGFLYANEAAAIAGNSFVTFSVASAPGYAVSFTNIPAYNIRHSSSGSTNGIWQYQVGGGAFTDIGSVIAWGTTTSASGNAQNPIDLSGIGALQNVPAGTNVTFRIVLWGGTGTGSWYVNNLAAGLDLQVLGSLAPVVAVAAPQITVQPSATNVFAGKSAALTVAATGTAPLNFQWLKNGSTIADGGAVSGALTNTLNFLPAAVNHSGNYSLVITNAAGAVTSSVAPLTVSPLPLLLVSNSPGGIYILASGGAVSNTVVIQRATNLQPPVMWQSMQTNIIGADGAIRFQDTGSGQPAWFYRLQIP